MNVLPIFTMSKFRKSSWEDWAEVQIKVEECWDDNNDGSSENTDNISDISSGSPAKNIWWGWWWWWWWWWGWGWYDDDDEDDDDDDLMIWWWQCFHNCVASCNGDEQHVMWISDDYLFCLCRTKEPRGKGEGKSCCLFLPKWHHFDILYIIGYNSNISKSAHGKEDLTPENAQIYSNAAKGSAPSILSCGFLQIFARWFGWPFWSSRGEGAQNCLVFWMMVGGEWGERNRDFKCVFTFMCFLSI